LMNPSCAKRSVKNRFIYLKNRQTINISDKYLRMIFEYDDYKQFVNSWIQNQERGGYGQYARFADVLSTTSVAISQIFKSDRELNLEQALKLADYLHLTDLEKRYFILLVERARAGTPDLTEFFSKQILEIRRQSLSIKNIISHQELNDGDKELFYSSWQYIAIWLAADLPDSSLQKISQRLNLPDDRVREIVGFLLERGLLKRHGKGFKLGKNVVHIPADSPLVLKHHFNWRMKGLESIGPDMGDKINYSAPMALSAEVAQEIQGELLRLIKKATKKVADSSSEKLYCLNIDWFAF
jgi:uncharacterized protein (TIGR02147 family)